MPHISQASQASQQSHNALATNPLVTKALGQQRQIGTKTFKNNQDRLTDNDHPLKKLTDHDPVSLTNAVPKSLSDAKTHLRFPNLYKRHTINLSNPSKFKVSYAPRKFNFREHIIGSGRSQPVSLIAGRIKIYQKPLEEKKGAEWHQTKPNETYYTCWDQSKQEIQLLTAEEIPKLRLGPKDPNHPYLETLLPQLWERSTLEVPIDWRKVAFFEYAEPTIKGSEENYFTYEDTLGFNLDKILDNQALQDKEHRQFWVTEITTHSKDKEKQQQEILQNIQGHGKAYLRLTPGKQIAIFQKVISIFGNDYHLPHYIYQSDPTTPPEPDDWMYGAKVTYANYPKT